MINTISGRCDKAFPKTCELQWVEESFKVIITRFDPLQVL